MLLNPIFNYDAIYDCFTCMRADRHIGNEGYAAECFMDFQDLGTDPRDRLFRIVKVNYGSPFPFRCCVVRNSTAVGDFSFFLPACQVAAYADGAVWSQ